MHGHDRHSIKLCRKNCTVYFCARDSRRYTVSVCQTAHGEILSGDRRRTQETSVGRLIVESSTSLIKRHYNLDLAEDTTALRRESRKPIFADVPMTSQHRITMLTLKLMSTTEMSLTTCAESHMQCQKPDKS